MVKTMAFITLLMMLPVFERVQSQQLSQRTFRSVLVGAVRKCYGEYKPPEGTSAIITFFTMPEMTHHTTKCFVKCLLNKFKLMDSKGNFKNESMQTFFNSLPESRFRASLEINLNSCLQEQSDDLCEKSYRFVQCFYKKAVSSEFDRNTEKP